MSNRKFASITGSLLARKGEAGPSPATLRSAASTDELRAFSPETWIGMPDRPAPALHGHDAGAAPHRLTLRLDDDRHRRLCIASARLQTSVQHLVAAALDRYLAALCEDELADCSCLKKRGACRKTDGTGNGFSEIGRPT